MSNLKIMLEDRVFTDYEDFGRAMYLYPDASEKLLLSNKFLKVLAATDKKRFDELIQLNHEVRDANAFVFFAQYIFCPHMELKHHGYSFSDIKELGNKILSYGPAVDVYLKDFLKFHLLSAYMKKMGLSESKPVIYDKILELERRFPKEENKTYFLLGFLLSECDTIIYEGKTYTNEKDFFTDMITSYHIINFSSGLEKNQYVYAWLEVKGQEQKVKKYQSFVETIEQMERNK